MDTKHDDDPEQCLTEKEMTRLERMREHLRYCGELVQPDHTVPARVTIIRDATDETRL